MPMVQLKQFVLEQQAKRGEEITVTEIAEFGGISRQAVARMMTGKPTRVDQNTIYAICEFFGIEKGQPIPFLVYDPEL